MAVKIIDNCCSPEYLDVIKHYASTSENWNLKYPMGNTPIEDKHLKLDIITKQSEQIVKYPYLAGIAMGLLIQIYEAGGRGLFIPDIHWCGISIKDKHRLDNIHTDHYDEKNVIKILGIINSDWKEEWGGSFFHDGTSNYIKPTSFCIFDSTKPHSATEIFTNNKRFAIDFAVEKA